MKWLKKFEELSPDVYRKAGKKLISIGHDDRGGKLVDYSNSLESNLYNMFIGVDGRSLYGPKGATYNFYFSRYKIIYGHSYSDPSNKFKDDGVELEQMVEAWERGNFDLSMEIIFYFTPSHKTKNSLHPSKNEYPLFSIKYLISPSGEGKSDDVDISSHYENMEGLELEISPSTNSLFGIFSDRGSSILFTRNVLPKAIDDAKEKLMDLYSILGTDNEYYEHCIKQLDKITSNYLYKTKLEDRLGNTFGGAQLIKAMYPVVSTYQ